MAIEFRPNEGTAVTASIAKIDESWDSVELEWGNFKNEIEERVIY
jgi:hypothetical protein